MTRDPSEKHNPINPTQKISVNSSDLPDKRTVNGIRSIYDTIVINDEVVNVDHVHKRSTRARNKISPKRTAAIPVRDALKITLTSGIKKNPGQKSIL